MNNSAASDTFAKVVKVKNPLDYNMLSLPDTLRMLNVVFNSMD